MTEYGFITTLQSNAFQYIRDFSGERWVRQYDRWNSPNLFFVEVRLYEPGYSDGRPSVAIIFVEQGKIFLRKQYKTHSGALKGLAHALFTLESAELLHCPCPWELNKKERAKWEKYNLIPV